MAPDKQVPTLFESGESRVAPINGPLGGNAVARREDAIVGGNCPEDQPRLIEFAAMLSRRHAVDQDATIVILLTALAGALGGARLITNPLGGCLPGSLNLLVFGEGNPPGLDAMRRATATLMEVAQRYAESTLLKGPQRLRRERIQLERYAEELNAKVRKAEAAAEALKADAWALPPGPTRESIQLAEDVESVRMRLLDLALEERPWLISDGLSPREIRELSARSFDRSLLNYSPTGNAWRSLLVSNGLVQAEMLKVLSAGWRGDPVVTGCETVYGVVISNMWRVAPGDVCKLGSLRESSIWDTFLFADIGDLQTDIDAELLEASEEEAWWDLLILNIFKLRPFNAPSSHKLTPEALDVFLRFYNDHRRILGLPPDLRRFATRRPELALKFALLLHLASDTPDADCIEANVMQAAADLAIRLGNKGMPSAAAVFSAPPVVIEVEIQKMAAKLRLHGPQRKRDLFRRYDSQDYSRLEPMLARAIEANVIKTDGEYFAPAN